VSLPASFSRWSKVVVREDFKADILFGGPALHTQNARADFAPPRHEYVFERPPVIVRDVAFLGQATFSMLQRINSRIAVSTIVSSSEMKCNCRTKGRPFAPDLVVGNGDQKFGRSRFTWRFRRSRIAMKLVDKMVALHPGGLFLEPS